MKITSLFLLYLSFHPLFAAPQKNCDVDQTFNIKGNTPEECRKNHKKYSKGKYQDCYQESGEMWFSALGHTVEYCVKTTMEKQFQKSIALLKGQKSKDIQKKWVESVDKFCEATWGGGTAGGYNVPGCKEEFWKYRFHQLDAIRKRSFNVTAEPAKQLNPLFADFFTEFCQLPASLWKLGKQPKDCPQRLMGDMQNRKLFAQPGDP